MARDPKEAPSDLIQCVSRAFRILEAVGERPEGLTVKQIARRTDLLMATAYHLVRTMTYEGYLLRREDGTYAPGVGVFRSLPAVRSGLPRSGSGRLGVTPDCR